MPDLSKLFMVEVDMLEVGLGAVLSQHHGKPEKLYLCAFFSHNLSPVEQNYDIGNCVLLTVKAWRSGGIG